MHIHRCLCFYAVDWGQQLDSHALGQQLDSHALGQQLDSITQQLLNEFGVSCLANN